MKRVSFQTALICILALFSCKTEPESEAIPPTAPATPPVVAEENTASAPQLDRVAIRHILIAHSESQQSSGLVGRNKVQAKSLAKEIRERLLQGESMTELAKKYSNDPSASRGGFLGASERGAWVKPFEDEAFSLKVDQISKVVETPYGFHVLRREALQEVKLYHLLVAHKSVKNVGRRPEVLKRTAEEAKSLAEYALTELDAGEEFSVVAGRVSDGPMAQRGADLGWFVRGELGPEFDAVAFDLDVGEHSKVIETVFGFHLIERAAP